MLDPLRRTPAGRVLVVRNRIARSRPPHPEHVQSVPLNDFPTGIAVTPLGDRLYVADRLFNILSVFDLPALTPAGLVNVGSGPLGVAIDPTGTLLLTANDVGNDVSVVNIPSGPVEPRIAVGPAPVGVAFHPSGRTAYVANSFGDTVSVIDLGRRAVVAAIAVGHRLVGGGFFVGPCASDADCDDGSSCSTESCVAGRCHFEPANDHAPCDNHRTCFGDGQCGGGRCIEAPVLDGTPCDDAILCTLDDECVAGRCLSIEEVSCPPGGECTGPVCQPSSGSCEDEVRDDGAPCQTAPGYCDTGVCVLTLEVFRARARPARSPGTGARLRIIGRFDTTTPADAVDPTAGVHLHVVPSTGADVAVDWPGVTCRALLSGRVRCDANGARLLLVPEGGSPAGWRYVIRLRDSGVDGAIAGPLLVRLGNPDGLERRGFIVDCDVTRGGTLRCAAP
jgi:YVTN family beta-propeller protein